MPEPCMIKYAVIYIFYLLINAYIIRDPENIFCAPALRQMSISTLNFLSRYIACAVLVVASSACLTYEARAAEGPWRLDQAMNLPTWFSLSGHHRSRYESLSSQYRGGRNGSDQILVFRTTLHAQLKFDSLRFGAELLDSRARLDDAGTPLSTGIVNPAELLQAYGALKLKDLFQPGSESEIRAGRITMDLGKRRLVARNRYRNTINGFTGLDFQWQGKDKTKFRAFYVLPVQRRLSGAIRDQDARIDKEHEEVGLWGLYFSPGSTPWGDPAEIYLLGLNEDDAPGRATRNRDLYTGGIRLYRKASPGQFDYEIESMIQVGESRSSAATSNTQDLDHLAHFQHVELGYTFDTAWRPQILFQYDYASGDDDAGDGDNNRFDTLFGARRFDFGPTSIYGAFARSNISSPALRLRFRPASNLKSFIAVRGFWLASDDDAWTTARISNPPGSSDNYIASQFEIRVRWEVIPKNLRIETGYAHLFAGDLMDAADKDDADYGYLQTVFWF